MTPEGAAKRLAVERTALTDPSIMGKGDQEVREYVSLVDAIDVAIAHLVDMRYAIAMGMSYGSLRSLLPGNYHLVGAGHRSDRILGRVVWLVAGHDVAGWTLDGYVIPRFHSFGVGVIMEVRNPFAEA